MQYILTEEEYQQLVDAPKLIEQEKDKIIMALCRRVANTEIVKVSWMTYDESKGHVPEPWGCILDAASEWYCNECPVRKICPYEHKNFSK